MEVRTGGCKTSVGCGAWLVLYGGPVVAGNKVFIGTNNEKPRDPKIKGDKGILLCLNAAG